MPRDFERPNVDDVLRKYSSKIESNLNISSKQENYSSDYIKFKKETIPILNRYERWCKSPGSLIKLNVSKKDEEEIRQDQYFEKGLGSKK